MARKGENIYKRKDGRWEARYEKGRNSKGQIIYGSLYGKSYREVKEKKINSIVKLPVTKTISPAESLNICDISTRWLESIRHTVKESTYSCYLTLIQKHIAEFVLPFFGVTIVSCFSALVVYNTPNMGDVTQSFLRAIQIASIFMIVYVAVKKLGRESLDVLLCAGCISYVTVVFDWVMSGFMNGDWDTSCLEAHGFIEATGLLFIFYCLSKSYTKRQKLVRCICCATILLLGGKRVAWVGIAWSLLVYFLFHKFREKKDRIIKVVMIIYFTVTFAYLILIKNNYFSLILSYFGIADNMRLSFWNFFRNSYELSLAYLGRGIQYTDNRMILSSTKYALRITNNVGIHNDILRTYIGWGCVPFLYYYYNFFVLNLNKIKRKFPIADIWLYFAIVS